MTFDHVLIEVKCTGIVQRPPADCLLGASGAEPIPLMQISVELDEAMPSPVGGKTCSLEQKGILYLHELPQPRPTDHGPYYLHELPIF